MQRIGGRHDPDGISIVGQGTQRQNSQPEFAKLIEQYYAAWNTGNPVQWNGQTQR